MTKQEKTKLLKKDRIEKVCMNPKDSNIYNSEKPEKHATPLGVK